MFPNIKRDDLMREIELMRERDFKKAKTKLSQLNQPQKREGKKISLEDFTTIVLKAGLKKNKKLLNEILQITEQYIMKYVDIRYFMIDGQPDIEKTIHLLYNLLIIDLNDEDTIIIDDSIVISKKMRQEKEFVPRLIHALKETSIVSDVIKARHNDTNNPIFPDKKNPFRYTMKNFVDWRDESLCYWINHFYTEPEFTNVATKMIYYIMCSSKDEIINYNVPFEQRHKVNFFDQISILSPYGENLIADVMKALEKNYPDMSIQKAKEYYDYMYPNNPKETFSIEEYTYLIISCLLFQNDTPSNFRKTIVFFNESEFIWDFISIIHNNKTGDNVENRSVHKLMYNPTQPLQKYQLVEYEEPYESRIVKMINAIMCPKKFNVSVKIAEAKLVKYCAGILSFQDFNELFLIRQKNTSRDVPGFVMAPP